MARPRKQGFDYFSFDVDFFRNAKIRIALVRFGVGGVLLFIYLLTVIYSQGYYVEFSEDLLYIASDDLQMKPEKIGQIINFFCKRSLFDDKLFTTDKVITSKGIQLRYQEMVKTRATKNPVTVNERFWLLKKEETETFIQVRPNNNKSEKNESKSENNYDKSQNNHTKQSKVNKSKVKQSKAGPAAADTTGAGSIDAAYLNATGRRLGTADYRAIKELTDGGVSENLIADVIRDIGRRGGKIYSFAYFLPAIREAAQKNTDKGLYPETASSEYIETVLDEEYLEMLDANISDGEYDYDD